MNEERKLKLIGYFFIILMLFVFTGNVRACDYQGVVIDGSQFDGCTMLIVTNDGDIFEPLNHLNDLEPGDFISFSYESDSTVSACMTGTPINITCLEAIVVGCNYVIDYVQNDDGVTIGVYNTTDFGPYHPQVVEWTDGETGEVLSTEPEFTLEYVNPIGGSRNVCVQFEVTYPDNSTCSDFICEDIYIDFDCFNVLQIDNSIICTLDYQPVCGCDGVTYPNQCEAFYHGGVMSWEPGPCNQTTSCEAFFIGYSEQQSIVTFSNLSTGDYTDVFWDFGDGSSSISIDSIVTHSYQSPGFYPVSLRVENDSSGCYSEFIAEIFTGQPENICLFDDCVYPGDANVDLGANVYDVLAVGLGYGNYGPTNPVFDVNQWLGQYIPDWDLTFLDSIDIKHADCDGNGFINEDDIVVIDQNYTPEHETPVETSENGLSVHLDFSIDTLFITDNTPEQVEVSAYLNIGTMNEPVTNMYGMALQLDYPEGLLTPDAVLVDYYDNSFLGTSNEVLSLQKDLYQQGRKDVAFTRKDRSEGVSGTGRVARVDFIIIVDVIDGYTEPVDFIVDPEYILVTDADGNSIPVKQADEAKFVIVDNRTTADIKKPDISKKVAVYPNPVNGILNVYIGDLKGESIELMNALGQLVVRKDIFEQNTALQVAGLVEGVYFVKVFTQEGIVTKKIFIER